MGRKRNCRSNRSHNEGVEDAADAILEDAIDIVPGTHLRDCHLEELFHKKGDKREPALLSITKHLTYRLEYHFVEKNFATLLYRFLFSLKKGSVKEISFACYAIGLLSMITHDEDNTHEVYLESVPLLTDVLKSKSQSKMDTRCLETLAVVTLFGAQEVDEIESTMQFLWEFISPKSDSDLVAGKYSAEVIEAAISSWSLILSSTNRWSLSHSYWKGAISCFLDLLDSNEQAIYIAAGEGLALIFENGSIEKFSSKEDADGSCSAPEASSYRTHEKLLKEKVLKKLEQRFVGNGKSGDLDFIKYFRDGSCPETVVMIGEQDLTSSWSRKVQLKFFVRFFQEKPFIRHLLKNEVLQDFFDFDPIQKDSPDITLYEPLMDEVNVRLYLPPDKTNLTTLTRDQRKMRRVARFNTIDKAKTKLLHKQRAQAEERDADDIFGWCTED